MALFAKKEQIELEIQGMTCGNCVHHVTEALRKVEGVVTVDVDLGTGKARVVTKGSPDVAAMTAAVEGSGYTATSS